MIRQRTRLVGVVGTAECGLCEHESIWNLLKVQRWVQVRIPLIPVSSASYYVTCDVCDCGIEVSGEELEKARERADRSVAYTAESEGESTEFIARIQQQTGESP